MKKIKIFILSLFLLAFAFLQSCSAENSPNDVLVPNEREMLAKENVEQNLTKEEMRLIVRLQRQSNHIGTEEALQIAKEYATILRKSDSINSFNKSDFLLAPFQRNNSKRKTALSKEELSASSVNIKNISVFLSKDILKNPNIKTKKNISIPDTLAYVFNVNGDKGYAIISADARINESMLAFVEKGSFNRQTDNPGMALYFEMLDAYFINSITEAERQKDSLLSSIYNKLDIDDISEIANKSATWDDYHSFNCPPGAVICTEQLGPIIPVKWGQHWPFNDSIPPANVCGAVNNINDYYHNPGGRYVTGCVATATAQLMAYWQYPSVNALTGMNATWAALSNLKTKYDFYASSGASLRAPIGKIFKTIGANVNMSYGCAENGGSGAYSQDAMNYLSSLGYRIYDPLMDWDYRLISIYINRYQPVPIYIRGCKIDGGCHAWLIDGWLDVYRPGPPPVRDLSYLFHNWGWNGIDDGVFPVDLINQTHAFDYRIDVKFNIVLGPKLWSLP